jgi:hypothetical protein
MNELAQDAQLELAGIDKIEAKETFTQAVTTDSPNYIPYSFPADLMELKEIRRNNRVFSDYYVEGNTLLIPKKYECAFDILYYKYPTEITAATEDTFIFELSPRTVVLVPYYIAGHAIMKDNNGIGTLLLNEYQAKISNFQRIFKGVEKIYDVNGW